MPNDADSNPDYILDSIHLSCRLCGSPSGTMSEAIDTIFSGVSYLEARLCAECAAAGRGDGLVGEP